MTKKSQLGQLLLESGLITYEQLDDALRKQKETPGKRLGEMIVELGYVKEKDVLKTLSKKLNLPYIENPVFNVDLSVFSSLSEDFVVSNCILPLYIKDGTMFVATSDPLDFYVFEDIKSATGLNVEGIVSGKKEIKEAQEKIYAKLKTTEVLSTLNQEQRSTVVDQNEEDMLSRIDSAPIVRLLNNIVTEAIQSNTSDIHIEPEEGRVAVRFRIDGDLREHVQLQSSLQPLLLTRIKIMAGMNIAEKRIPQDGRIVFQYGINEIDMRVSSLPTIFGEKMVLRLLGTNQDVNYNFEDMGFSAKSVAAIRQLIQYSNGIILATGPTGSGKTTTLYTILSEVINPKMNIVTIEDPVEKRIKGVNQVQVNTKAGLTFASGLRSILRQDPDVVMIGEIRDGETAEIAVRASITGHLVISTLHTNDSFSSISRLMDMGVESYLLADTVRGVIAQRLVKRVCPYCRKEVLATDRDRTLLKDPTLRVVSKGEGCQHCGFTGYRGRIAVVEIFMVDQESRRLIAEHGNDVKMLREYAVRVKMITMREELLGLLKEGITSVDEAIKILYSIE